MGSGAIEATGGVLGGAGGPHGQLVVVRFDAGVFDVFTETASHRLHARLIQTIELREAPGPTGEELSVEAGRQGVAVPVRFEGAEREALLRILDAVRGG